MNLAGPMNDSPPESGEKLLDEAFEGLEQQAPNRITPIIHWLRDPKSRIVRIPIGILLILASFFWFLPVLGMELFPIGLLLIAQDVPVLQRPVGKMMLWLEQKWAQQQCQLTRPGAWGGYLLGFSLGGFFEGILLHQILGWHHVLSAVQVGPFREPDTQLLADRIFYVVICSIAIAGVWSMWRGRASTDLLTRRKLISHALIGFGAWHVMDVTVAHWFLGIHRTRMDSSNPLAWDLLWLGIFGLGALLAGLLLSRRHKRHR